MKNAELESLALDNPLAVESAGTASPCGCGGCGQAASLQAGAEGELPDLNTINKQLDALLSEMPSGEDELAFAGLDADLSLQQDLEFAGLAGEPLPPLNTILGIVERYPGLKITFSF